MQEIKELSRRRAPAARLQPLAFDGSALWAGSWETDCIYKIDPKTGNTLEEFPAPGKPYGIAVLGGELRVVVSLGGDDDDRYFYRFVPGSGFDLESKTPCPDLTGSHLASDGKLLYLAQMHNRRILVIAPDDSIQREIPLPSPIGGMGFLDGTMYAIVADDEFEDVRLATVDLRANKPEISEIAKLNSGSRSLAHDGNVWWTNYREAGEIVSFAFEPSVKS